MATGGNDTKLKKEVSSLNANENPFLLRLRAGILFVAIFLFSAVFATVVGSVFSRREMIKSIKSDLTIVNNI
ncbi:MAG: hypothetical protein LBN25_04485, partial [Christensenellaceae bacterium]|nr:hypothetical protein [Christensenellaceae bacterium]